MVDSKQMHYDDMNVDELVKIMAGPSRIKRKNAAKELAIRVSSDPVSFKDYIPDFVDALSRPEAQTRWEALEALSKLVAVDVKACSAAIEGAEEALFDEKTSLIRESAIRFLSHYGAYSASRSKEVWFLIREALEQFHGEIEYDKMLDRINYFAAGNISDDVVKELRVVVKNIALSVGGPTKARLERISKSTKKKPSKSSSTSAKKKSNTSSKKSTTEKKQNSTNKSKTSTAKTSTSKKTVTKKTNSKKTTPKNNTSKKASAKKSSVKASSKANTSKKSTTKKSSASKSNKNNNSKKASIKKSSTKKK